MYQHCGNRQALEVLQGMANWTAKWSAPISGEHMQDILNTEYGGMNEVLYNLSAATGEDQYAHTGDRFTKNQRSIIKRLWRVMDVRQGVLERNSFKMLYLYNELAALRHRTEELEGLAHRAYDALARQRNSDTTQLLDELQRASPK
jgi:Beta-L-arabinofuranosidase, GH127